MADDDVRGGRAGDAMASEEDPVRSGETRFAEVLPRERIACDFGTLIAERKVYGADRNPDVLKKTGSGESFLISAVPPMRRLLAAWDRLFGNRVSPVELLRHLAVEIHGFEHLDAILLFTRDRILYDCQIVQGKEAVGHFTLDLYRERDRIVPFLPFPTRPGRRVVYIEGISLTRQSTGYASALFRRYERLFHDLGFHLFRLKASLSVGKYYWAKEGFDCSDRKQFREIRDRLWDLVRRLDLPVAQQEVRRLTHMSDVASFRRDIQIPVWRDREGYYTLERDAAHPDEFLFPLGKAFLLCAGPWDGHKVIYTDTPRRTGLVWSEAYLSHGTPIGHPEGPKRLTSLWESIRREGMLSSLILLEPYAPAMEALHSIHDPAYLESFREAVARGDRHFATRDCAIGAGSYEAALLAAGGVMAGIDAVFTDRADNAFCAVRPPGHHAGRAQAMGFCFVNNVAVGAAYARSAYGIARVCILDWDAHHGNGTQDLFAEDPETLFVSLHEHPSFC
ncbi:MAG TPA: histone deacetylase, partial [Candidatus Methylomirabilis sp.]|nr:histone deacetylase [Candidatus Methylomirabilis sp.]